MEYDEEPPPVFLFGNGSEPCLFAFKGAANRICGGYRKGWAYGDIFSGAYAVAVMIYAVFNITVNVSGLIVVL